MSALLTAIVLVFLLCHSTKVVTNCYEAYQVIYNGDLLYWPPWAEVLSRFNHLMLAVNASINILIYVVKVSSSVSHLNTTTSSDFEIFHLRQLQSLITKRFLFINQLI